jgi:hypothetical protein
MIRGEALTMRAEGPRTQVPHLGRALRSAQEWTGAASAVFRPICRGDRIVG